ncbi:MAG TPA: chemotaxis protein CheB [Ramlibacter sp.]
MQCFEKVVVLGASAGGVQALQEIVAGLPADFAAPLLVGLHVSAKHTSYLPSILGRAGVLPARHAVDGESLQGGRIYIAPPGNDLFVVGHRAAVQPSAAHARFRPSLDALFQSTAHHHGRRSIGIVLSGAMDDGAVGLRSIAKAGGTTVVQSDAAFDSMPQNAMATTDVDHVLPAAMVGALLGRLTSRAGTRAATEPMPHLQQVLRELEGAMRDSARHCALAGVPPCVDIDTAGGRSPGAALLLAERRIALLQRVTRNADARGTDCSHAMRFLAALESCSGRLRAMMSRDRIWAYQPAGISVPAGQWKVGAQGWTWGFTASRCRC